MKWFQHDCDMHTDLKVQAFIQKHNAEGYAVWMICLELLGKEGKQGRLKVSTRWQEGILKVFGWSSDGPSKVKLDRILTTLAELKLIDAKAFKYGNLYVPNFTKRADNWTKRMLRRSSEHATEKVPLDKIIIDNTILGVIKNEFLKLKGWESRYLMPADHGRLAKRSKELLLRTNGDLELVLEALRWMATKGWNAWTLETVGKYWAEFMKHRDANKSASTQEFDINKLKNG